MGIEQLPTASPAPAVAEGEKEHHTFGGSTAKYWANCPGWLSLVSTLPKQEPGEAARKGTALHTGVLERKMRAEIEYLVHGTPPQVNYDGIPEWPLEGPEIAEEFWKAVWDKALENFVTGKQVYIEKHIMLFPDADAGGTADVIILYYNDKGQLVAVVGDLKTGFVAVDPDDEQIKMYLASVNLRAREAGKNIEVFKGFIYQPSQEPHTFREATFTKSEIERATKKFEKAIAESKKPKPKFKTGDHCRWCRCQSSCKAYADEMGRKMELASVDFALAEIETLPDDVIRQRFFDAAKFIEYVKKYKSELEKHIIREARKGHTIEGTKIVQGVGKRQWIDDEAAAQELMNDYGLSDITKRKLKGLGDIKKLLQEKGMKGKEADKVIDRLCEKPLGEPLVVPPDDDRPPMKFDDGTALLMELDTSDDPDF